MMVLRHIVAVLCEMFSVTTVLTDRSVEEDPLHGFHARQIWIIWIFTCGDTKKLLFMELLLTTKIHFTIAIMDACQTIRIYPGIFERMRRSMMRRALNLMQGILEMNSTNEMFSDTCWRGHFHIFWELVPKVCLQVSVTICVFFTCISCVRGLI
jgi:hypothetical protein